MRPAPKQTQKRRGFSLILVIGTIGTLLAFWAIAYRVTVSLIRVESSRELHQKRQLQSVHALTALDWALTLLEVSNPPSRQVYTYSVDVLPSTTHAFFTVTFRPNDNLPGASNGWTVTVTPVPPGTSQPNLVALPNPGDNPQWPSSP
jgi:hypothetical protein